MVRTYRYRVYPNQVHEAALRNVLYAACSLYNHALAYRRKCWAESRRSVRYCEQAGMWRDWRNEEPDDNPLRLLNMSAGQQVLRRLDSAYLQFLKGKRGRPRFRRLSLFNSVSFIAGDGASVKGGRLYVQNVGTMRVRWHRMLPEGDLKNIIVVRKPSGWHVCLQVVMPDVQPAVSANPPVGVDMGISHALALSDGTCVDSPQPLRTSLRQLRVLQRSVARKRRGGSNRRKAVGRLARLHERIGNHRKDFWHKATRRLVDNFGKVVLEDLSLGFMLRSRNLSLAAHDVGLGTFRELLDYKATEAGVEVVAVNPRNTSQACSGCGSMVAKDLNVRVHSCPDCGLLLDRDVNAARNVLRLGHSRWALTWPIAASVAQDAPLLWRGELSRSPVNADFTAPEH
ncbi:MAG: IS200/IS605 family element transposase accessory protein TnpB [Chloroflexi bacterium]|nr:IS200/IS605 family element transposase accessory protein TnpB [Chloroflexota bacterium]